MKAEALRALRDAILACDSYRHEAAQFYGLSVLEAQAIGHLSAEPELGAGELARRLNLTPGSVTALVDRLQQAALIERRPHPSDRRRTLITLSDRGRGLAQDSYRWFDHALDDIHPDDFPEVTRLLSLLAVNLRRQAAVVAAASSSSSAGGLAPDEVLETVQQQG